MKKLLTIGISISILIFCLFLSINSYSYILPTPDKNFSISNNISVITTDNIYTYSVAQVSDTLIRVLKHNIETGQLIKSKFFSRVGYEFYTWDIRLVGNSLYIAGYLLKESTNEIIFYSIKLDKSTFSTTYYFHDDHPFLDSMITIGPDALHTTSDGSLVVACSITGNEIIIIKFSGSSFIWQRRNYSQGWINAGALVTKGNYVYISGACSFPNWYIAKFNYSNGNFVGSKEFLAHFCIDRRIMISQMEADDNYLYIATEPSITSCEGSSCDPGLYDVGKFSQSSLNKVWFQMQKFENTSRSEVVSLVLSDCDIYVTNILTKGYFETSEVITQAISKEGDSLGFWHSEQKPYSSGYYASKSTIYTRDNVNLQYLSDPIEQQRMITTTASSGNTDYNNFWIPKKVYGRLSIDVGWNLFSLPVIPDMTYTPAILSEFDVIYKYVPEEGYIRLEENDPLYPGVGYWGYSELQPTYLIYGREILQGLYAQTYFWEIIGIGTYPGWVKEIESGNLVPITEYEPGYGYEVLEGGPTREGYGYWVPSFTPSFYFEVDQVED